MKKVIFILCLLLPMVAIAAGGSKYPLDKAEYDLTDKSSLQSGAQTFMNYCLGCHQMQYQRYQRTFEDLPCLYVASSSTNNTPVDSTTLSTQPFTKDCASFREGSSSVFFILLNIFYLSINLS